MSAKKVVIADFVAPTDAIRKQFEPDYIIWMNTIEEGRYADTNAMFESVSDADFICNEWDNTANITEIVNNLDSMTENNE